MKKVSYVFSALVVLGAIIATAAGVDLSDIFSLLGVSGGISLAAVAAVGTVEGAPTTAAGLEAADIVDNDVERHVVQFNPDRFPLDTITRNYARKKMRAKEQRVKFFQKSRRASSDTLNPAASGNGQSEATPAKSFTAVKSTAELTVIYVSVANPSAWAKDDTLVMRGLSVEDTIGDGKSHTEDVVFYVASKNKAVLELVPLNGMKGVTGAAAGKYIVPSFAATATLYRLGRACSETAMQTSVWSNYPEASINNCQNFMCQIEESTFADITAKQVDWTFEDMELENIYDFREDIESSFLWGAKNETKDEQTGETTLFTEGITRMISKTLTYGTATAGDRSLTVQQYNGWLKDIFASNDGSNERILFAGAELIESIMNMRDSAQKVILSDAKEEMYLGVNVVKIVNNFGTLRIVHHKGFDAKGWAANGLVLDIQHIYKREFVPMQATELDLKKSGQRNSKAKVLQEVSCLYAKYPDCHAIITPTAA